MYEASEFLHLLIFMLHKTGAQAKLSDSIQSEKAVPHFTVRQNEKKHKLTRASADITESPILRGLPLSHICLCCKMYSVHFADCNAVTNPLCGFAEAV